MNVTDLIARYSKLKSIKDGYWLGLWREVRRYVYPTESDYLNQGGSRGADIFDTTAIEARERLAAGMYNWMAPPDKRWFQLTANSDELAKDEDVKDYFSEVTKIIAFAMANSNWTSVLIEVLNDLASGLDGIVYCEDGGNKSVLNFKSMPVESVCYSEDEYGNVDTVFRELEMTSRQLLNMFKDTGKLPEIVKEEAIDPKRQDKKHKILHAVYPRPNRDEKLYDNLNMPFADIYVHLATKMEIYESGFEEYPFAVCRFRKSNRESFGRGAGVDKLPDIKMLNRMRQAYIMAAEEAGDPSWLIPDGSITDGRTFDKDAGSVNIYKADISGAKPEQVASRANLNQMAHDIQEERQSIRDGFYLDIFDPLGDLRNITATEAEIRNDGKIIPFAPIAGRLHSELFKVIIHRVYGIVNRRGLLPEIPEKLIDDPDYKVEFVSKIALSIKKLESLGWLQTEASLAGMMSMRPEIMDNFSLDDVARDIALVNGVSPKWLTPVKERDHARQERAIQMQQQQQAEMLAEGARNSSNLSKAPEAGSPLEAVMSGEGV